MAGNTFGQHFTLTTCGESHGPYYCGIIDGVPAGFALSEQDIQQYVDQRKPGQSPFTSQRREPDRIHIISGVFEGKTTGTPIGILVQNTQARPKDYETIKHKFRPGHADYTYYHKYGHVDWRGGGRASARETVLWVAAGAVAQKILHHTYGIQIRACLAAIGDIALEALDWDSIDHNPFFCADPSKVASIESLITDTRKQGDSIGAKVKVEALNVPVGLGQPVFHKLDAQLAHALMSINAVKAVEIGDGLEVVHQRGSQHRDELTPEGFVSNHAGGVLGGLSSGQTLRAAIAIKPTSSIVMPGRTVTLDNEPCEISTKGRHDPCVGIRAVPVAQAMVALVLMDQLLEGCIHDKRND